MAKVKSVKVRLPLIKGSETQDVFVAVNGRRFKIKRGVEVEVPYFIANVLRRSEEQEFRAAQIRREAENKN